MSFHVIPLPNTFLEQVRQLGIDDLGQAVQRTVSINGGEPCRDVLRRAYPGEEIILASFTPFAKAGPYKEYGPIFVLAQPSGEAVSFTQLPISTNSSNDSNTYFSDTLVLRGYNQQETMVESVLVTAGEAEAKIQQLLQVPEIAFVQARFPTAGCFALRIERA